MIVAFDVNGTLTQEPVRKLFQALDRKKCQVVVWSSLGETYARHFCEKYGLVADEYMHKDARRVDVAIDDVPDSVSLAEVLLLTR